MPVYEFRCRECGGMSELRVSSYSASQAPVCSSCGSHDMEKLISAPNRESRPSYRALPAAAVRNAVRHHPALPTKAAGDFESEGGKTMQDLIEEFMAQKRFAIVGATADTKKYGNEIFRNLTSRGYEVYPVNPRLKELEGTKCYPSLSDIPVKVDVVDFVVPPPVTMEVLKECQKLGLDRIWLQPGSESEAALAFCNENNLRVVHSVCVMMN